MKYTLFIFEVNTPNKSVIVVGFHEIKGKKKLKFQVWFRLKINALKAVYQTKELVSVRGRGRAIQAGPSEIR